MAVEDVKVDNSGAHGDNSSASEDGAQGIYHQIGGGRERAEADADTALLLFNALAIITFFSAVLCAIANLITLVRSFIWMIDLFPAILRMYAVALSILVAATETEWTWLLRKWPYMQYWFARGMIQILVAVMTKALSGEPWEDVMERLVHTISGYMLLTCGFIHTLAGIVFVKQLQHRRVRKKEWRAQAIKDLEEIDIKRRKCEAFLAEGA